MRRRSQYHRGRWIFIILLVVAAAALSYGFWLPWFGTFTIHAEDPVKTEAVVALAGDFTGGRIVRAAELVREGLAPKVYVSSPGRMYGRGEGELAIAFAVARGYPASYFELVPVKADSTQEEAAAIWHYLQKTGVKRLLIVTSEFHTRRAGRIYRSVMGGQGEARVVAVATPDYHPETWWKTRTGQKLVFMEWTKTLANWWGI